ncbi:hypothetical protein Droror1_Dr00006003 [Drosera rotundifolia]
MVFVGDEEISRRMLYAVKSKGVMVQESERKAETEINRSMCVRDLESAIQAGDLDHLQLSTKPYMERNLEFLMECMDGMPQEQQKVKTCSSVNLEFDDALI